MGLHGPSQRLGAADQIKQIESPDPQFLCRFAGADMQKFETRQTGVRTNSGIPNQPKSRIMPASQNKRA
jgi:hypothetical protein